MDKEFLEKIDTIISLMIPDFNENNYEIKGLPLQVLKLCDYENTVLDMVKKLKKDRPQIDNSLSKLRGMGLIKTVTKNNSTVYVRLR